MSVYKEYQFCWWMILVGIIHLVIVFSYFTGYGERPLTTDIFVILNVVFVHIYILFYGLTTVVNDNYVLVWFGIGLVKKKIPIERIRSAQSRTNFPLLGWGIRWVPGGMMFNAWGFEAVELDFFDSVKVFRIGSQDPTRLKFEIEQRMRFK